MGQGVSEGERIGVRLRRKELGREEGSEGNKRTVTEIRMELG